MLRLRLFTLVFCACLPLIGATGSQYRSHPEDRAVLKRPEGRLIDRARAQRPAKTEPAPGLGDPVTIGETQFYLGLFRFDSSPELWLFRDEQGMALTDGDIALGPFKTVLAQQRRLRKALSSPTFALTTLPGVFARWPDGEIPYSFDGDWFAHPVPEERREPIREAMSIYETLTPLRFREKTAADESWLRFARTWDLLVCPSSSASAIGRVIGPTTIYIQLTDCRRRSQCQAGELDEALCESFDHRDSRLRRTALHEIGHALGFKHEHSRPDRDTYIDIDFDCINQELISAGIALLGNYNISGDDYQTIGPYDFSSIMHYPTGERLDDNGEVTCRTLVKEEAYRDEGDSIGRIGPNTVLSRDDINALFHLYRENNQRNEAGDRFAQTLIPKDFDGDGYEDLAVAAPFKRHPSGPASGAVLLYKGTADGYLFWKRLNPPNPEGAQYFGAALAAADFDLDGVLDLAVGAPGTTVSGQEDAGSVFLYSIEAGLDAALRRTLMAPGGGESWDRFGQSLAVGRFFLPGNYPDNLAIERRRLHLAIGTPGGRNGDWRPGTVWFWNEATPEAFGWPTLTAAELPWAGGLGHELKTLEADAFDWMNDAGNDGRRSSLLASARFDDGLNCGEASVYVLIPEADGGPGVELGSRLEDPEGLPFSASLCAVARSDAVAEGVALTTIGRGFGRAIAVGDFNGDGKTDVAIGDPDAGFSASDAGPGAVYVFTGDDGTGFELRQRIERSDLGVDEAGASFGAALDAWDFDGDELDDLVVGAPGEAVGGAVNSGRVHFYRGCSAVRFRRPAIIDGRLEALRPITVDTLLRPLFCRGALTAWSAISQPGEGNETNDFFGWSFAITDFDHDGAPDLAVGTPGEAPGGDPRSGYVHLVRGQGDRGADALRNGGGFSQEVRSPFQ